MSKQTINIGASPNDGTGTPLRTSFDYCNLNFTELYTAVGPSGNNIVCPGSATITGDLTVRTNQLIVNSSGVGVGTTPSAWSGIGPAIQVEQASLLSESSNQLYLTANGYFAGGQWNYINNASADQYYQIAGSHVWRNGAGGSPGTAIGWSTLMTLNSTGLGVGVGPSYKLDVTDNSTNIQARLNSSNNNGTSLRFVNTGTSGRTWQIGTGFAVTAGNFEIYDATAAVNRLSIDSSGNVGIGVTPSYKLDTYTTLQGAVTAKQFANRTANKILVKRFFGITADTALFSVECGTAGAGAMAAFEINVFATGQKSGSSGDRQFYGKWYVTRNLAGAFTITSAFSSGSSGAFTVAASGTSLNVNGIFSVISDGSACVEVTGYIGGRDTVVETALNVTMP